MGQYFKAVNTDKREYVCPWCIGGGAKLWEWAANPQGAIFTLLLRKSDREGGGDYYGPGPEAIRLPRGDAATMADALSDALAHFAVREGRPIRPPATSVVGRWAGDAVMLVGDYDSSRLWDELGTYRNISEELAREWNGFIDLPELKLKYDPCGSCREQASKIV